jgi:hypothetical protein
MFERFGHNDWACIRIPNTGGPASKRCHNPLPIRLNWADQTSCSRLSGSVNGWPVFASQGAVLFRQRGCHHPPPIR